MKTDSDKTQSCQLVQLKHLVVDDIINFDPRREPDCSFNYVDISSIDNVEKRITQPKVTVGRLAPSRARQVIRANDVLVATTRPNLNAVALVPPSLDGAICSTGFCVLRCNSKILPQYLFLFVQSELFVSEMSDLVQGALYPAVTDRQVKAQYLPLVSIESQNRIIEDVAGQHAAIITTIAAIESQLAAARRLPSAILRKHFPTATSS